MSDDERMNYMIDVMHASQGGQEIEMTRRGFAGDDEWVPCSNPDWNWAVMHYRIKPLPPLEPREFWIHPATSDAYVGGSGKSSDGYIRVREVLTEEQT